MKIKFAVSEKGRTKEDTVYSFFEKRLNGDYCENGIMNQRQLSLSILNTPIYERHTLQ